MNTLRINGMNGRPMMAKILRPGDSYGLNGCLTWGQESGRGIVDPEARAKFQAEFGEKLGLEFYDMTR